MKWQHKVPQGDHRDDNGPAPHSVAPRARAQHEPTTRRFCAVCGFAVKKVPLDDGPEGLKALFRF